MAVTRTLGGWLARKYPEVLFRVSTVERVLAITIDDSPDPGTTPRISDALRKFGCRSTFFIVGQQIAGNERVLEELVAGGHELGNHMWDTRPSWRLAQSEFRRDFARTQATLKPFADVRFFRPASGWFNRSMLDFVQAQGCQTTLGSIYPFDAVLKSARFSTSHILRNASPGAIVVLHDNKSRGRRTSKVLGTLLPALLDQGYALVTLSELQKRQSISSEVPG